MRLFALAFVLCILLQEPAQASEPAPQYSADQLAQDFAAPTAPAADGCAVSNDDCEPQSRDFSLVRPGNRPPAPVAPTQANVHRAHHTMAQTAPAHGRNLLITFANDSTTLTPQAKANARVFAQVVNSPSFLEARFAIDGHTNAVGSREHNLELSRARAESLVNFLVEQGVERSRLDVMGYGFDRPADAAHPAAASNRRVEARRLN
jgi:outer membrane protein OmpA-like peptidoglycan-associated protein